MVLLRYKSLLIILLLCCGIYKVSCNFLYSPPKADINDWWGNSVIYEIFTMSFFDTNSDGYGDLKGVTQKVDYLADLGVTAIWLTPFFQSPMQSSGYDITDYEAILPLFGTMDDFKNLIHTTHNKGIKVFIDFVPNHTSRKHDWFTKSVRKIYPYTDYYVWRNAKNHEDVINKGSDPIVPNNWLRIYPNDDDKSAWIWNKHRQQYYFVQFAPNLPDLNYRESAVHDQMGDVLKFWLNLGVDGIRVDALKHMYEKNTMDDEPLIDPNGSLTYGNLNHTLTVDQPEVYDLIKEWRELLDGFASNNGSNKRVIMTESYSPNTVLREYYKSGAQIPTYFQLMAQFKTELATKYYDLLENWFATMPNGSFNSVLQNHDNPRISSRYGSKYVDILNAFQLFLPGPSIMYYGGEIGMGNQPDQTNGNQRSPMQWDNSTYAGFSDTKPWSSVCDDYKTNNVKTESDDQKSHLNFFKTVLSLRKFKTFVDGELGMYNFTSTMLVIRRFLNDYNYVLVLNFNTNPQDVNLSDQITGLKKQLSVVDGSQESGYNAGDKIDGSNNFTMQPISAVVLSDIP